MSEPNNETRGVGEAQARARECSLSPQRVNEHVWYYESPTRIELYHEIWDGANYIRTQRIHIQRRKLEASLKRMNVSRRKCNGKR